MSAGSQAPSARRAELLELAHAYVLTHGLAGMSLRPLAEGIGSSPRVLLFLFGSKDGLVRALLDRMRSEELDLLDAVRAGGGGAAEAVRRLWGLLSAPEHRGLLRLWAEGYARSLLEADGPWAEFAARSVDTWLTVLGGVLGSTGMAERTVVLAVLRGALLDLLATGDVERTTAAVELQVARLTPDAPR